MRAKAIDSRDKDLFLLVDRVFLFQQSSWFRLISGGKICFSLKLSIENSLEKIFQPLIFSLIKIGRNLFSKFSKNLGDPERAPSIDPPLWA